MSETTSTAEHVHATPELRQKFAAARYKAVERAPYFRSLLLSFVVRECPGINTIGITEHGFLLIDWRAIERWTSEELTGALLHECLHKLNRHLPRKGDRDPKQWNDAADLSINDTVDEMGAKLPQGVLRPASFSWPKGLTADEYYLMLDKLPKPPGGSGMGCGQCGSAGGCPLPGEPDKDDADARSEAETERSIRETAEAIKDHAAKNRGHLPDSLKRFADAVLAPARVPWRRKLQRSARNAAQFAMGAVDYKYDAPSRRQAAIGYGTGKAILPRLRKPVVVVDLAIDTSGSMSQSDMAEVLQEAKGIFKAVGATVRAIICDAEVHEVGDVSDVRKLASMLKGGGGTDFRPVFEAIRTGKRKPNILVFATDGCGPAPAAPPKGVHVIWLLVGSYRARPTTWGEYIEVDKD